MDLRDLASEGERMMSGLIVAHPRYERNESGVFELKNLRDFLAGLNYADVVFP